MPENRDFEGQTFRAVIGGVLGSRTTLDLANAADAATVSSEVTVPGAALGDFVLVSLEVDVADLTLDAQVTAADTVTVTVNNNTGGAVNLASTTVNIAVLQKGDVWDDLAPSA